MEYVVYEWTSSGFGHVEAYYVDADELWQDWHVELDAGTHVVLFC